MNLKIRRRLSFFFLETCSPADGVACSVSKFTQLLIQLAVAGCENARRTLTRPLRLMQSKTAHSCCHLCTSLVGYALQFPSSTTRSLSDGNCCSPSLSQLAPLAASRWRTPMSTAGCAPVVQGCVGGTQAVVNRWIFFFGSFLIFLAV